MKRHRVLPLYFDLSANALMSLEATYANIKTEDLKCQINQVIEKLGFRYGQIGLEIKLSNLRDLGFRKLSILAYHNELVEQIRDSFVCGFYYPSLTGACALGERILNHLILDLRSYFQTSENRNEQIFKDKSFHNWNLMISKLEDWEVLLPEVVKFFHQLKFIRHKSLHFNLSLSSKLKEESLNALTLIQEIIGVQFSAFGPQPWFITEIPGEIYIKKNWESKPFILEYYLKSNSVLVGPNHKVVSLWDIHDIEYSIQEISDDKFVELRKKSIGQ